MTHSRFLLRELVARDLRGRYAGSAFGFIWAFVHPVWQMILLSLVFSVILRIPLTGEHTNSFAAFLFAGLLPWAALQEGVTRSATVIADNAQLVKKMRFPSELLVYSVVVSAVIHAAVALVMFGVLQGVRGELDLTRLPWLTLGLAGQLLMTTGLSLGVAALQVYLRDIVQGINLVLSALFYLTPIVYTERFVLDSERAPRALAGWLEYSPLATMVRLFRTVLISGDPPKATSVAVMLLVGGLLLAGGYGIFRRLSAGFSDEL